MLDASELFKDDQTVEAFECTRADAPYTVKIGKSSESAAHAFFDDSL